ncbi:extracellular solute-binding protein [Thermaerobacter composti]|uniref:Extracellular solute-binding protein n=1 Tax=Thermaerobacter composti TaxID=554949 RepID=A0ABZ0QMQ5_9FIRM|nr:extracellular solute-binding protein [Thermaerobacter composti]WPD18681.1 extracellular solute-binding protein [Thermaerobacter composti]
MRSSVRRAVALIALLSTILAGCGGGTGDQANGDASEGQVTIEWWHIWTDQRGDALQAIADEYMKQHPNVKIEITVLENEAFKQKIAAVMQSGSPPDLFQSWGGGTLREYAKAGLVKDITADLQQDGWGDTFEKAFLDMMAVDGRYYGVPLSIGIVGFWYNKELFAKAGITSPPKTWDELLDAVRKLKAAGITPIALGEGEKWPGHFYWAYLALRLGGREAFEKAYTRSGGSFADAPFVEAGRKLQELLALEPFQQGFLSATYADASALVGNGMAAMELMGHWAPAIQKENSTDKQGLGDKLGFFPFPAVPGGQGDPADVLGGGDAIAVGRDAPPEAIDFLKFLTKKENLKPMVEQGFVIPVVKGAEEYLTDPLMKELVAIRNNASYLQLYYDQVLPPSAAAAVNDAVQNLMAGKMTPEQVAQHIEEAAAAALR